MDEETITYNFNQICRFCLTRGGVMSTIFDEEIQGSSVPLLLKIMTCVSIQVSAGDGLPSLICHRCLYQMERSYEFKAQCEYSDAKLRQYISQTKPKPVQRREVGAMRHSHNVIIRRLERPADVESLIISVDPAEVEVEDRTVVLRNSVTADQKPSVIEIKLPPSVDISPLYIKQEHVSGTGPPSYTGRLKECQRGYSARPHTCSLCGKAFGQRRELNRHHLVHSGEKPFACPVCSKRFARRDKVVSHLKVHGRQSSYSCFQCPAIFVCQEELRRHEMGHTGKQPWRCYQCYKVFYSKAELVKHRRTHREATVYSCHLCSVTYRQHAKLIKHLKIHTKSKFVCNPSFSAFSRSQILARHAGTQLKDNPLSDALSSVGQSLSESNVDRKEDEANKSLSRLGQNPEILLLPIPQS